MEARRQRRAGRRERQHLVELAHRRWVGQAEQALAQRALASGGAPAEQPQRARLDAERAQECALRHRAVDRGAAGRGRLGERPEIDLGREIGRARIGEGVAGAVAAAPPAACRRSARRPRRRSRSRARPRRRPRCGAPICRASARARRADLGDRAGRRIFQAAPAATAGACCSDQLGRPSSPTTRSRQPCAVRDQLMHRQRVEELVGDQQQRPRRDLVEALVPARVPARETLGLAAAQARAALDQVEARARRGSPARARVARNRSASSVPRPGPSSTRRTGRGAPWSAQAWASHSADDLAEGLADLGRGDEVAGGAERVVAAVVAEGRVAERQLHEARDRERPLGLDQGGKHRLKIAQRSSAARGPCCASPARCRSAPSAATAAGPS